MMLLPKDVPILTSRTCNYVRLHKMEELRLHTELSYSIMDYLMGPKESKWGIKSDFV
jgi:hypothetical protein